ncbi:hypothetical protein [Bradyrhizobium sp. STM 3562]|uniref:hypothetical protein n=1 Tax=Bradyrhizobium sp. STM 3562 TaxID=578924 RepID=UPI00388F7B5A
MRREILHEKTLRGRDVGILDLISRNSLRLRNGIEQWRPLTQRNHAKLAFRVSTACQPAVLSNRSHGLVLMNARHSLML